MVTHTNRLALALVLLSSGGAWAQEMDGSHERTPVLEASDDAEWVPTILPASTKKEAAAVRAIGGYDTATEKGVFDSEVRVRLFGPLTLRGGVSFSAASDEMRPRVGAAVQFLSQERQGIDGTVSLSYKAEGFTELEGEIEGELAFGRRFGKVTTVLNLAYGQDGEGNERDGEVRLAALARVAHRVHAGLQGQVRFDLGSDEAKLAMEGGADLDLVVGPTASYSFNRFALFAQAGVSYLKLQEGGSKTGAIMLGGLGTAF